MIMMSLADDLVRSVTQASVQQGMPEGRLTYVDRDRADIRTAMMSVPTMAVMLKLQSAPEGLKKKKSTAVRPTAPRYAPIVTASSAYRYLHHAMQRAVEGEEFEQEFVADLAHLTSSMSTQLSFQCTTKSSSMRTCMQRKRPEPTRASQPVHTRPR